MKKIVRYLSQQGYTSCGTLRPEVEELGKEFINEHVRVKQFPFESTIPTFAGVTSFKYHGTPTVVNPEIHTFQPLVINIQVIINAIPIWRKGIWNYRKKISAFNGNQDRVNTITAVQISVMQIINDA